MEPDVRAVVDKISARYSSRDTALDKCSIACGQLIVELEAIGVTEVQQIEVSEPRGSTSPHRQLAAHSVLRVGIEVADLTWMQIDKQAEHPYKLYSSIDELRGDWAIVRDWKTGKRSNPQATAHFERAGRPF